MIGGADNAAARARQQTNADGFFVTRAQQNYIEVSYLCGFLKLKKYDRIDLFWGRCVDIERDLIRSFAFIQGFMFSMILYIIFYSGDQTYTGNI